MERDSLMNKVDDNVEGMIVITAYKDNTYKLESSFGMEDTQELLNDTLCDMEEDGLIGFVPKAGEYLQ
jgi:hypothetical protein